MSKKFKEVVQGSVEFLNEIWSGKRPAPPIYDPPYDSPLEADFAWHLVKYLDSHVKVVKQLWIGRKYRIDFVLVDRRGRKIGIELDGKNYHLDEAKDAARDKAILATRAVEAIYRVRGKDAFWHTEDVLFLLRRMEPEYFSQRGARNLNTQASESARNAYEGSASVMCDYYDEETDQHFTLKILVRS